MLQSQQQLWQGLERQTRDWLNTLTERATLVQDALNQLPEHVKTWALTRSAAQIAQAPAPVLGQIDATIATLQEEQELLQLKATDVLDLQNRVASETTRCQTVLAQISAAQNATVGGIFERGRSLSWNENAWVQALKVAPSILAGVASTYRADTMVYLREPSRGLPIHVGIFATVMLMLLAVRRKVLRWVAAGQADASSGLVFDRPFATALMVALLMASGPYSTAPANVKQILELLALAPMIRLIRPMIYPTVVSAIIVLVSLFVLDSVRQALMAVPLLEQWTLTLESIVAMPLLGWFLYAGHVRSIPEPDAGAARGRIIKVVAFFGMIVFAAGLAASVLGYLRLARLLSPGALVFSTLSLTFYAVVKVLQGVAAFALRVWPFIRLRMVLQYRDLLERRFFLFLRWMAMIICAVRYLDYVGLLDATLNFGQEILAVKLGGASFSTSVGNIFAFFLTVYGAYLFSKLIRFVLQEDIYPRAGLPIGLSYALSSLLNYTILALGFVIAAGVLGVSLTQVTVLIGAFGVGIGFGLQSVVNNFVSGLILLFEQPIHVDDMVEVGDLLGKVRRIGMRASIVRTRQGSDIIVPNAQLVTEKVTNWTLNDKLRRIALPVGVNYGAAPREVIKILEATALLHPKVLPSPAPRGIMVAYGDNSINFELRAWTDEFEHWRWVISDLAIALYDALRAAGMSFPFPQRDVHLLQEPVVTSKQDALLSDRDASLVEDAGSN